MIIALDQFVALALCNPCEQSSPEFDAWMRGCLRGANNRQQDAPTDNDVPAYREGWAVGQQWYRENVEATQCPDTAP